MKHSKTIIFTLALSILIISTVSATEINKKVEEASESKCGDSCQGKLINLKIFSRMSESSLSNEIPGIS